MSSSRLRAATLVRLALVAAMVAAALVLAACGDDDDEGAASNGAAEGGTDSATNLEFIESGKLTVGMNLQFKPQMYLDDAGDPAGYDVDLLNELAPALEQELNIKNLDFNGLIPGLQSNQFDMVSVGLSPTPERKEVVDFTRAYVPYVQVLGVPTGKGESSPDAYNKEGVTITALQGSTGEQLAKKLFPKAKVNGLPDQNAAFLEVATGRADGIVVEDYLLAQFDKSNSGKLEAAPFSEPLDVQYGSWAVPKGHEDFVAYLDKWLCEAQDSGKLEELYKKNFGVEDFPEMPSC
jgi:ABC-type amino acid transport substrate-binding protein